MTIWLLEGDVCNRMRQAVSQGRIPSAADELAHEAAYNVRLDAGESILQVSGKSGTIPVVGVLTGRPNLFARWYGGGNTTYREIREAHARAVLDPNIEEIELYVASPGGEASSEWFATMDVIANSTKPVKARVSTMAASAAYGIASQAESIHAENKMTFIGSIGVAATYFVWGDEVSITSSEAPNKRPDVTTEEGKKVVRDELDQIHDIFVDFVAKGRKTDAKNVNQNYGKGGTLLADAAVKVGMIDTVGSTVSGKTAATGGTKRVNAMDSKELQEKHPAVYQSIKAEGAAEGQKKERDRVSAHLIKGEAVGAMDIAMKAIKDGLESTDAVVDAQYFAAMANKKDTNARTNSDAPAADALDGKKTNEANVDKGEEAFFLALEEKVGGA